MFKKSERRLLIVTCANYLNYMFLEAECLIYSLVEDNKRFTIEIISEEGQFKINQFLGTSNSTEGIEKYENELIEKLKKINEGEKNETNKKGNI